MKIYQWRIPSRSTSYRTIMLALSWRSGVGLALIACGPKRSNIYLNWGRMWLLLGVFRKNVPTYE